MKLKSEEAKKVCTAAKEKSDELGIPMSIAIVGVSNELLHFERAEGANPITADVATAKAHTALQFRSETQSLASNFEDSPLLAEGVANLDNDIILAPGGVPIVRSDEVVGAVGASGGTSAEDHEIATAGIAELTD